MCHSVDTANIVRVAESKQLEPQLADSKHSDILSHTRDARMDLSSSAVFVLALLEAVQRGDSQDVRREYASLFVALHIKF